MKITIEEYKYYRATVHLSTGTYRTACYDTPEEAAKAARKYAEAKARNAKGVSDDDA